MINNSSKRNFLRAFPLVILLLGIGLFSSCEEENERHSAVYTESSLIKEVSKAQVKTLLEVNPLTNAMASKLPLTDVDVYRIVYTTENYDGKEVKASGALLVPKIDMPLTLVSYQHGTIWKESDAPSEYDTGKEIKMLATPLASCGFAVVVPDYIGYGASKDLMHPYEHAQTLAKASYDMIQASKKFLAEKEVALNGKMIITGYSEGGSATMALHKYIEENTSDVITMSAPASGVYNKSLSNKQFVSTVGESITSRYFLWVVDCYKKVYNIDMPWDQIVNAPFNQLISSMSNPFELQNMKVSLEPNKLLTPSFINAIKNESNEALENAIKDNNRWEWTPKFPMKIYYSAADDLASPANATTAIEYMQSQGAPVQGVKFEGFDHYQAFGAYFAHVFQVIMSQRQ